MQFPGSNCEAETRDALRAVGAEPEIVRWNVPLETWERFEGFVLPGGFSYEDRVRAGAIAAKHAVLDAVAAAADAGRPVLGICNGAQVLVEAGLVPGIEPGHVEVALAANAAPEWHGYYCDWVHLLPGAGPGLVEGSARRAGACPHAGRAWGGTLRGATGGLRGSDPPRAGGVSLRARGRGSGRRLPGESERLDARRRGVVRSSGSGSGAHAASGTRCLVVPGAGGAPGFLG